MPNRTPTRSRTAAPPEAALQLAIARRAFLRVLRQVEEAREKGDPLAPETEAEYDRCLRDLNEAEKAHAGGGTWTQGSARRERTNG